MWTQTLAKRYLFIAVQIKPSAKTATCTNDEGKHVQLMTKKTNNNTLKKTLAHLSSVCYLSSCGLVMMPTDMYTYKIIHTRTTRSKPVEPEKFPSACPRCCQPLWLLRRCYLPAIVASSMGAKWPHQVKKDMIQTDLNIQVPNLQRFNDV